VEAFRNKDTKILIITRG